MNTNNNNSLAVIHCKLSDYNKQKAFNKAYLYSYDLNIITYKIN